MSLCHLSLSWLKVNGLPEESVHAIFSSHAIVNQEILKKSSERSLLNSVMKIPLWLEELALLNLDNLPLNLRSNTSFKRFFQSSDNFLRMNKISLESCVSSLWSQWLIIFLRKKIKFTHLVLSWLPVKINPGRLDLLSLRTSPLLLNLSEKKSQIITLFKPSPSFLTITRLKLSTLPSPTSLIASRTWALRKSATWCSQPFKTHMLKLQLNSKLEQLPVFVRWPTSLVKSTPPKKLSQS